MYKDIEERFKDKVQLLHGKIKKETQDEIIKRFISNEKPILVSTTVIQVGIDVSTACLLIIYDANYFGLSTLHQLRGRVGRSGDFALALLVYDGNEKEAKEKLDFLASSNDGLAIAQFDLKQRGSGSYSGTNQSGKSELMVCNFVDDLKMFEYAKQDASFILDHPSEKDHAQYLKSIDMDEKLKNELSVLQEISSVIVRERDVKTLLNQVLAVLNRRMGMLRGTVTLRHGDTLDIEAAHGLDESEQRLGHYRIGEGLTGHVAETGRPHVIPDIRRDRGFRVAVFQRADGKIGVVGSDVAETAERTGFVHQTGNGLQPGSKGLLPFIRPLSRSAVGHGRRHLFSLQMYILPYYYVKRKRKKNSLYRPKLDSTSYE